MDRIEIVFEHYKIHIDLYKHYLELLIKFNLFYFANKTIIFIQFVLLFPFIMSLIFSGFFFYASVKAKNSREEIVDIALALDLKVFPEFNILVILLKLFSILFILISILLLLLIVFHNCIF